MPGWPAWTCVFTFMALTSFRSLIASGPGLRYARPAGLRVASHPGRSRRGYQRAMVSFCRTQLGRAGEGGRVEEVAQEVFLAAYQSLPRFQRTALTGSMGMMRQHAKHNYRGAKVEPKQL